jgi:hypothetical protein
MNVNPNRNPPSITNVPRPDQPTSPAAPATAPDFAASANLTGILAAAPEVRADAVARAKALIADPNYPNTATVEQIAQRLAEHPSQLRSE